MSLDNAQREPVLTITGTRATKLVQHDGAAFIALDLTTPEGTRRFLPERRDRPAVSPKRPEGAQIRGAQANRLRDPKTAKQLAKSRIQ